MATIHTASRAKLISTMARPGQGQAGAGNTAITPLPGVPNKPLDPAQQLEALRRTQGQAEQRVQLGMQLFKAAEAHTSQHRAMIDEFKKEQQQFKEQLQDDVARSLQSYDQWVGHLDQTLTQSLHAIEDRISQLQAKWAGTEERINSMLRKSETLLDQSRELLRDTMDRKVSPPPPQPVQHVHTPASRSEVRVESHPTTRPMATHVETDDKPLPMPVMLASPPAPAVLPASPAPQAAAVVVVPQAAQAVAPTPEMAATSDEQWQAPAEEEDTLAVMHGGPGPASRESEADTQLYSKLVERLRERRGTDDGSKPQT